MLGTRLALALSLCAGGCVCSAATDGGTDGGTDDGAESVAEVCTDGLVGLLGAGDDSSKGDASYEEDALLRFDFVTASATE